jgi:hypothetical protein
VVPEDLWIREEHVQHHLARQPLEVGEQAAARAGGLPRLFDLLPEAFAELVGRLRGEDVHAAALGGEVLGQAERALDADAAGGRKEVRHDEDALARHAAQR